MTVSSKSGPAFRRTVAVLASAGALGLALAACTPDEPTTTEKGTTPPVQTGNPAPRVGLVNADDIPATGSEKAVAALIDTSGKDVGEAVFRPNGSSLSVLVNIREGSGIAAGVHGMHIHSGTTCVAADNFASAGGHLQVDGHTGDPASGDLVSINVLPNGSGSTLTSTSSVDLQQVEGKTIVIHQNAAGTPGDDAARLACGVIGAHE